MKSKSKSTPKQPKQRTPNRDRIPVPIPTADLDIPANVLGRLTTGRVSGAEVARLSGLSLQRACFLLRRGESPLEIVLKRRPGIVPIVPNGKANGHAPKTGAVDDRSFAQLQKDKLAASVEKINFDLDERRGAMVPRSHVEVLVAYISAMNTVAVRELLALPSRLRDSCDSRSGAEIETLWDTELRRVLTKLSSDHLAAVHRFGLGGLLTVTEKGTETENVKQ